MTEGPGYNIFAIENGRIHTPDQGVLEGITRRTALELCQELGLETVVAPLAEERLRRAEEVFITSTAGGIMPVAQIYGQPLGSGAPGRTTRALQDLYWAKHDDPAWTTPVNYDAASAQP